jgi:hypothetical protein
MSWPQGDLRLLATDLANRLLSSNLPARLAYVARDGTPRVSPVWFHWDGEHLVAGTFTPSPKVTALETNPAAAVSIDTDTFPPEVLQLRGTVDITHTRGPVPEYAAAARRYLGPDAAVDYLAELEAAGTPMARIALRPDWVGTLDFRARLPAALGGVGAEQQPATG